MTSRDFVLLVLQLAAMLGFAVVFGNAARRLRQPAVVGEMLGGIVLGPTILGLVAPSFYDWLFLSSDNAAMVRDASVKLGMLFFLFVAGLDINLSELRTAGRRVLLIGLVGTLLPLAVGVGLVYALPRELWGDTVTEHLFPFAIFIGINLANSANPVLARILMDLGLLKDGVGTLAMAATIVDDLINWTLFAIVLSYIAPSSGTMAPDSLPISIGLVLLLFVVVLVGGHRVAPSALRWVRAHVSWPSGFIAVVAVVILLVASASEGLGVHAFLGAFLVGAAMSGHLDQHAEAREVITHSSLSFFAPIYFLSLGMTTDFIDGFDLGLVLVILVAAVVSKLAGVLIGARLAGMPLDNRTWAVAWGLNARGATGIILAGVGLSAGVIDDQIFVAIVLMALITSLLAGPMMDRLVGRHATATTSVKD